MREESDKGRQTDIRQRSFDNNRSEDGYNSRPFRKEEHERSGAGRNKYSESVRDRDYGKGGKKYKNDWNKSGDRFRYGEGDQFMEDSSNGRLRQEDNYDGGYQNNRLSGNPRTDMKTMIDQSRIKSDKIRDLEVKMKQNSKPLAEHRNGKTIGLEMISELVTWIISEMTRNSELKKMKRRMV